MNDVALHLSETLDHILASIPQFKPEFALIIVFLFSIIATLFTDRFWKQSSFFVSIIGYIISFFSLLPQLHQPTSGFFGMLVIDDFSVFARGIIVFALLVSTIFIQQHFKSKISQKNLGDVYTVLLTAGLGLNLLTITTNWLLVFIAIETLSISSYILVGYFSENKKQSEAAMKYVLFGAVCSAVMLYGLSLLYGFTGNLDFTSSAHIQGLTAAPQVMTTIALLFVFTGIGFKLSFVPFHAWAPDVYEGAPTPVTAFLSTVPKVGAIVLLARVTQAWTTSLFYFGELTILFITVVAIITMLAGNLIALRQHNMKRMMAYSSIGHTGFLLMAVLVAPSGDPAILLFYLCAYVLMNLAAFAFIDALEQKTGATELESYAGLGKKMPIIFTGFTFIGISLIGLPPTVGFVGKLLVFSSVFERHQSSGDLPYLALLITGALTSVISLFYYFKIPLYAFLRGGQSEQNNHASVTLIVVIGIILTSLVFGIGIFPDLLLGLFK
ncbi:NADH-quinone oxidoreductase subunit N [Sphingobacterium alkalisoli]|uniref:NADH-quinone oxidoreductase subunit N n=1 Tax=Sphingobacterium alkalisoli TaxID=1874115 RepID=A0A4U0GYP4_9SPHI|nr:NADH-quinone oxidoreductase subunit N [Sphingobacterium alkalisoli]TJY64216.1 NADH-quinone oxidoreductase subunit N [Sphingobacterium alkalisoli]GGH23131.1 NADH-quinone oxidoreductase subunit N [Sphingobacterium alkalisoli]